MEDVGIPILRPFVFFVPIWYTYVIVFLLYFPPFW
jgi:hypothetical protein